MVCGGLKNRGCTLDPDWRLNYLAIQEVLLRPHQWLEITSNACCLELREAGNDLDCLTPVIFKEVVVYGKEGD